LSRTPARRASGAWRVVMIDLHSAADDVCGIVLVLIVGFEHVEDQRLDLVAGGAPYAREMVQSMPIVARTEIRHFRLKGRFGQKYITPRDRKSHTTDRAVWTYCRASTLVVLPDS